MQTRFTLPQSSIPHHWYNLLADFSEPVPPPLHPGTRQPITRGRHVRHLSGEHRGPGDELGALD